MLPGVTGCHHHHRRRLLHHHHHHHHLHHITSPPPPSLCQTYFFAGESNVNERCDEAPPSPPVVLGECDYSLAACEEAANRLGLAAGGCPSYDFAKVSHDSNRGSGAPHGSRAHSHLSPPRSSLYR